MKDGDSAKFVYLLAIQSLKKKKKYYIYVNATLKLSGNEICLIVR